MPIGYKYESSGDAGYVNWAEVAKGFTDKLSKEVKDREARKAAYDERDRKIASDIANAPMGQFKDANDFTSNYVQSATKQKQIASKLFKAGKIDEKQYTLMQNNIEDGTKTLFDLTKAYQDKYATKMAGITSGKLQALNTNMMATIEGFADFSSSKAIVDPNTGVVNLAKMKFNDKTKIWEMTNDIMPVGGAMRNIGTDIETFDTDAATTNSISRMGKLKTAVIENATMYKAGTITEFLNSPEMFVKKFPEGQAFVDQFNKAVTNEVDSLIEQSPYNLTSVLTQNTKGYDATSFTYDKDEAAKDPKKILLTMDPGTKLPIMDEKGPNYDKQRAEAFDFIRTQMLNKLDKEKNIQSISQLSDPSFQRYAYGEQKKEEKLDARVVGENLARIFTGNEADSKNASEYLKQLKIPNYMDDKGIWHVVIGGKDTQFDANSADLNKVIDAAVSAVNTEMKDRGLKETDIVNYAKKEAKGKSFVKKKFGEAVQADKNIDYNKEFAVIARSISPEDFKNKNGAETVAVLQPKLTALGVTVSNSSIGGVNYVTFSAPGKKSKKIETNAWTDSGATEFKGKLDDWLSESFPNEDAVKAAMDNASPDQAP